MIRLRTVLTSLLKEFHPDTLGDNGEMKSRVHFQKTKEGTPFPYIIYNLPNSIDSDQQEIFNFDVDIWDNQEDTTYLETLADTIWKKLNHYRYMDDEIQFSIYRENRLPPLEDADPSINRRKLIFQLRYFDRRLFE